MASRTQAPNAMSVIATTATKAAAKVGLNARRTSFIADATLFLTLLTMVPYDKELAQLMPVSWTPWIIKIGLFAQIALRYLKSVLVKREFEEPESQPQPPVESNP